MLTRLRDPAPPRASTSRPAIQFFRTGFLALVAVSLAACGDGGGSPNSPTEEPQPPQATGSIIVKVTNSAGAPIAGAGVTLNGGFDGRVATTDAGGEARFDGIPAGQARVSTYARGYYDGDQTITVTDNSATNPTLVLEDVTDAIPVVLGSKAVASNDGGTLTVDLDIALLDKSGAARETLTASDFRSGTCEADEYSHCASGDPYASYTSQVLDASLNPVPMHSQPALATAILLDQESYMASFDPTGLSLQSVNRFLDSVAAPDVVTAATFQDISGSPVLTTYGEFTSDARSLKATVNPPAGWEAGTSPLFAALADVVALTAASPVANSGDRRRSVVAVSNGWDASNCTYPGCTKAEGAAIEAAVVAGIPVNAIGTGASAPYFAALTGGVYVEVINAAQLPIVFQNLNSIISRNLASNRVRLELHADRLGVFRPGVTVIGYMTIQVSPNSSLNLTVVIPI